MELKIKKKRFNKEFRESAVQLVENGKSAAQVARELGIPEWQVQTWARDARNKKAANVRDVNLLEELKRFKKENAWIRAPWHLWRFGDVQSFVRVMPGILPVGENGRLRRVGSGARYGNPRQYGRNAVDIWCNESDEGAIRILVST